MPSSQFALFSGIMPSRWAMNSSGNTVVLEWISTMSMASSGFSISHRLPGTYEPTVGMSAMTTLRIEFANLT